MKGSISPLVKYITPENHFASRLEVHPSQRQHHVTPVSAPLHVITAISNPQRYYSRYRLYQAFEKMCADAGAVLWTVELALRDRHHEITQPDNPHHIQLRSPSELWHKENLLNIAIQRLPADWEYVAWIDADVTFARPDWVVETIHQLQHYKIVQMFSHAQDVGPQHDLGPRQVLGKVYQSFLYSLITGEDISGWSPVNRNGGASGYGGGRKWWLWHTGYAWAARRSAISDLGGLGDCAPLGSADHHMAAALIGRVRETIHGGMHRHYKEYWDRWQARALKYINRNVGYVPGLLLHYWHGPKADRRYNDRWKILVDNRFDPLEDMKYDPQGVLQLTERNWKLRNDIREYFRVRNEDSIEV